MFAALYFKEWREKALVFFFELGILVLLLAAPFVMREKADLQEWLVYAILLLFFPFAALVLGASGFEAEYRQGAWAYLFSRPVSRPAIWLAKFSALLSMLVALWAVFLVAWAALPSVRALAGLPSFLLPLYDFARSDFPWWSLGLSLFFLTVAFSLSLLHERQFNILFAALVLGLLFPAAAWNLMLSKTGGFMAWLAPAKAFRTLLVSQILTALAFAGAALRTIARSDFSQPRKQMRTFAGSFAVFIGLAAAGTVGSAVLIPIPSERNLDLMGSSDGKAVYATERGVFSYDAASGRVRWLTRRRNLDYWPSSISSGQLAYTVLEIQGPRDAIQEIWVANTDGTGRRRLVGRDTTGAWSPEDSVQDLSISPDGRTIAILTRSGPDRQKSPIPTATTLWTVNSDGSGLEPWSLETILADGPTTNLWLSFVTWAREGKVLVFVKRQSVEAGVRWSLWAYDLDLKTASKVRDDAVPASRWWGRDSRLRDILAIRYPHGDEGPRTLALLNLATGEETEIAGSEELYPFSARWDPTGEKLLIFDKRPDPEGRASCFLTVYSVAAGKAVAERAVAGPGKDAYAYGTAWMPDGRVLALDPDGRYLRIFGPDLQDAGRIDLPARIQKPSWLVNVGDKILLEDEKDGRSRPLWRLDVETKRWKRIY